MREEEGKQESPTLGALGGCWGPRMPRGDLTGGRPQELRGETDSEARPVPGGCPRGGSAH